MRCKAVSWVDTSKTAYERKVLMVDGKPFFFNGIQIRADKVIDMYGYTEKELREMFRVAKRDGFTVVNSQVRWMDIQPDLKYMAANDDDGIRTVPNRLNFDFTNYKDKSCTAAKIRLFFNRVEGINVAKLYGIKDGSIQCKTAGLADYDTFDKPGYYDFDVTEYLNEHCMEELKSEFILNVESDESGIAELSGIGSQYPPQLILSRDNAFDWTYVDNLLCWADEAGIKLEILWFGTDTVSVSIDWRIPYYVLRNYQKSIKIDGTLFFEKKDKPFDGIPGVYRFLMCKNDEGLRDVERNVVRALFDHIAEYSTSLSDPATVIGCQVANEPAVGAFHMERIAPHCFCETCLRRRGDLSEQTFRDQTMWEYCNNLARGVKRSAYPVWTRVNNYRGVDAEGVCYNEEMKRKEKSELDFIGFDPYSQDIKEIFAFGHDSYYAQGENFPMVMENGGSYENTAELILAALAGGSFYNVYDMCSTDTFGLYVNTEKNTMIPNGEYVQIVRQTNEMLNQIAFELATKQPDGAGGDSLVFFNELGLLKADIVKNVGPNRVRYKSEEHGIGIAVYYKNNEMILLSTANGEFVVNEDHVIIATGYALKKVNATGAIRNDLS